MIDNSSIYLILLIISRISAFIVTAPVFSSRGIPAQFKIGLSLFIGLIIYPSVTVDYNLSLNGTYVFHVIQEVMFGLSLGFIAQMIFSSIQVAGQFIDMQIGFALANVIDPQTGAQGPVMGNFKYMFAVLLFLTLNIHHLFIEGIISSYYVLPLNSSFLNNINNESIIVFIMSTFLTMFVLAFKIAAPIVVTMLLTDIALGIVARTVPQLNVFVVGLPLKLFINYAMLLLISAGFIFIFREMFEEMIAVMKQFIDLMGL